MNEPIIREPLLSFLKEYSKYFVVIGSIARGSRWPKDLDLLYNYNKEDITEKIRAGIKKYNLKYESCFPGNWSFIDYGWMVEILPIHYGPSYSTIRRRAGKLVICGIEFWMAQEKDAPKERK